MTGVSQSDMGCDTCDSCDGCFLCLVHVYVRTRVNEVIDFAVTAVTAVTKSLLFLLVVVKRKKYFVANLCMSEKISNFAANCLIWIELSKILRICLKGFL